MKIGAIMAISTRPLAVALAWWLFMQSYTGPISVIGPFHNAAQCINIGDKLSHRIIGGLNYSCVDDSKED
jgi:hypothetical protein